MHPIFRTGEDFTYRWQANTNQNSKTNTIYEKYKRLGPSLYKILKRVEESSSGHLYAIPKTMWAKQILLYDL